MPARSRYALVGVLVALLAGLFIWKFGDSTGPVDASTDPGQQVVTGWKKIDGQPLDPVSRDLAGVAGAAKGIPQRGTYLVNLWYSACGPCKHEMPWLQRLSATGAVKVIGVTRDSQEKYAVEAMNRAKVTYPNLWDPLADFWDSLAPAISLLAAPNTVIVVDGKVTWSHIGPFKSYRDLHDSVTQRL
jgi:hypothetical protein